MPSFENSMSLHFNKPALQSRDMLAFKWYKYQYENDYEYNYDINKKFEYGCTSVDVQV